MTRHSLRVWVLGASAWLLFSLVLLLECLRSGLDPWLFELSGLSSLLWMQFGFAGLFNTVSKKRVRDAGPLLLITVVPPALLFLAACCLSCRVGIGITVPGP